MAVGVDTCLFWPKAGEFLILVYYRMVFKRTVRRVKKRTWYGKRYMSKGGAGRLVRDVKWIKSQLNVEKKYVDINQPVTNIGTSWSLTRLNGLIQGNQATERNGASVRFKSFRIVGNMERTAGNHRVRMIIFIDKEPTASLIGSTPNQTELLMSTDIDAFLNFDAIQQRRFRILYDRTFMTDGVDSVQVPFKKYIKMNMVTKWLTTTGGGLPQNIQNNAMYIAFLTDDTSGTGTNYKFQSRLTFVDN